MLRKGVVTKLDGLNFLLDFYFLFLLLWGTALRLMMIILTDLVGWTWKGGTKLDFDLSASFVYFVSKRMGYNNTYYFSGLHTVSMTLRVCLNGTYLGKAYQVS